MCLSLKNCNSNYTSKTNDEPDLSLDSQLTTPAFFPTTRFTALVRFLASPTDHTSSKCMHANKVQNCPNTVNCSQSS